MVNHLFVERADPAPILREVKANEHYYGGNARNKRRIHQDTHSIMLKGDIKVTDEGASFPDTLKWLNDFAFRQNSVLFRAIVVRLNPGGIVLPHVDTGTYYQGKDRYHFVLESDGSEMRWGEETWTYRTGDVFWFNNHVEHSAHNPGQNPRTHLIFDMQLR